MWTDLNLLALWTEWLVIGEEWRAREELGAKGDTLGKNWWMGCGYDVVGHRRWIMFWKCCEWDGLLSNWFLIYTHDATAFDKNTFEKIYIRIAISCKVHTFFLSHQYQNCNTIFNTQMQTILKKCVDDAFYYKNVTFSIYIVKKKVTSGVAHVLQNEL